MIVDAAQPLSWKILFFLHDNLSSDVNKLILKNRRILMIKIYAWNNLGFVYWYLFGILIRIYFFDMIYTS